jgi:hypothetical protein
VTPCAKRDRKSPLCLAPPEKKEKKKNDVLDILLYLFNMRSYLAKSQNYGAKVKKLLHWRSGALPNDP